LVRRKALDRRGDGANQPGRSREVEPGDPDRRGKIQAQLGEVVRSTVEDFPGFGSNRYRQPKSSGIRSLLVPGGRTARTPQSELLAPGGPVNKFLVLHFPRAASARRPSAAADPHDGGRNPEGSVAAFPQDLCEIRPVVPGWLMAT